jgi:hypothetical protein
MQENIVRQVEHIIDEYIYVDENTGRLCLYNDFTTTDIATRIVAMLKEKNYFS